MVHALARDASLAALFASALKRGFSLTLSFPEAWLVDFAPAGPGYKPGAPAYRLSSTTSRRWRDPFKPSRAFDNWVERVTSALCGHPHLASGLLTRGGICRRLVQLLLGDHALTSFLDGPSESTLLYRVGEYHADRYVSDSADTQEVDLALGQVRAQANQHDQFLWPSEFVCLDRPTGAWPGFSTELDKQAINDQWNDLKHKRERSTLTEARWRSSYASR
jgi:hypothetical protein